MYLVSRGIFSQNRRPKIQPADHDRSNFVPSALLGARFMRKRNNFWIVGVVLSVGVIVFLGGTARAASEWEWTAGQGWMRGAGVARPTPKEQLHYAYELERRSEFMDAAQQYFLLVQTYPASEEAGVGLQRLARCLFEMENYYTSFKAIEQVIETYPNTGRMSDLVEIELRIAKKMMVSQTPDLLSGKEERTREFNIRRALEILDAVIEHDPYGPVAAEAYLVKGEAHMFINEVQAARKSFETVRDEFPRSEYVERARLGILTADSLLGQARPQEVQEQIQIVREMEREKNRDADDDDDDDYMEEVDDVEGTIRQLAEIEATKMMEQAEQYRRMGTRKGVSSSEFLYKEIVRRYPGTPQSDEAMARLGHIRVPKEENRIAKAVKNINMNPFSYSKDPEPPWIIPQMSPDDMVMVDAGLGPIAGVAESGDAPRTSYSAGVRPAARANVGGAGASAGGSGNFSPATLNGPAPKFVDGVGEQRTYSSEPDFNEDQRPASASAKAKGQRKPAGNPLPTVKDDDLIAAPRGRSDGNAGGRDTRVSSLPTFPGDDYYAASSEYAGDGIRASGLPNPNLGAAINIPNSDLVDVPQGGGGYNTSTPYNPPYNPQHYNSSQYGGGGGQTRGGGASPAYYGTGWSIGDDLR